MHSRFLFVVFAAAPLALGLSLGLVRAGGDEPEAGGAAANGEVAASRPHALVMMEQGRRALVTGEVEWLYRRTDGPGGVPMRFKIRSRFTAHEEMSISQRVVDSEGEKLEGAEATNVSPNRAGAAERGTLLVDGRFWERPMDATNVTSIPNDSPNGMGSNARVLGLAALVLNFDVHDTIWKDHYQEPVVRRYEASVETNGLEKVVVHRDNGITTTWLIDPQRGWNPTQASAESADGKWWTRVESKLKKYDDTWFPAVVTIWKSRVGQGKEPSDEYRVTRAAFNKPNQAKKLRPADVGIEPGMRIGYWDHMPSAKDPPGTTGRSMIWNGSTAVSEEDFRKSGMKRGPAVRKQMEQALKEETWRGPLMAEMGLAPYMLVQSPSGSADRLEADWLAYVRSFGGRRGFKKEQMVAAEAIVRDCMRDARAYIMSHGSALKDIQAELQCVATSQPDRPAHTTGASKKFRGPIDEIFEKRLRPRVRGLATAEQNALVAASRPGR